MLFCLLCLADGLCHFRHQNFLLDAELVAAFFGVDGARDVRRYYGNGLHYVAYRGGTFYRVVLQAFQQDCGLEADKVGLVRGYIVLKLCCAVFLGEAVGVVAVGKQQHLYVQALGKQHVDASQRRFYSGRVAVVEYGDVVRKAVYHPYLPFCQRCA